KITFGGNIFMGNKLSRKRQFSFFESPVSRGVLSLFLAILLMVSILNNGLLSVNAATNIDLPPEGLTYEEYPPLKEVYEDYFSFGIFGKGEIEGLLYNY